MFTAKAAVPAPKSATPTQDRGAPPVRQPASSAFRGGVRGAVRGDPGQEHGVAGPVLRDFTRIPNFAQRARTSAGSARRRDALSVLQAKLAIGPVDDPLEREADRVSAEVLRSPGLARSTVSTAGPTLQMCPGGHSAGVTCPRCMGEQVRLKSAPQAPRGRPAELAPGAGAPDAVLDVLGSPGQPLDRAQRGFYESRLGHSLGHVRLHAGPAAARSAAQVHALAYTVGEHVVFAEGRYQPGSREGQQLLAHELVHTLQQRPSERLSRAPESPRSEGVLPAPLTHASPRLSRQMNPNAATETAVGSVTVYLGGGPGKASIVFTTARGSRSYTLDSIGNLEPGHYPVRVTVKGNAKVEFHFDSGAGRLFHFGYSLKPGQPSPATLFARQGTVEFLVSPDAAPAQHDHAELESKQTHGAAPTVAERASGFKRLVRAAGKVRMAENRKALADWSSFLQKKLTPAQVNSMVRAQEVLDLQTAAKKEGGQAMDAYDMAVSTGNPLRRQLGIGQVRGQYRACTGCHLTIQADNLEKENPGLARSGMPAWTPINQDLRAFAGEQAGNPVPRPGALKTTNAEGLAKDAEVHDPTRPHATAASAALATIQPYLRILGPGPGFYDVLPADVLEHHPDPQRLLAFILARIEARREAFANFAAHIDDPDFNYLDLRPIVRDLLPLQDAEVRSLIQGEMQAMEEWEHRKSILMWGVALGLLLLTIFPPTSAIGIAGVAAVEGAMAAYAVTAGLDSIQEGYWLSQTTGASNVTDPEQQEAAGMMIATGLFAVVLGGLGLKGAVAKGLKLVRVARAASAARAAAEIIDGLEGEAGGNTIKISGIKSGNPTVKITSPTGETVYDGPLKDMPQTGKSAPQTEIPTSTATDETSETVNKLREGGRVTKRAAPAGKKGAEIIQKSGGEAQAAREYNAVNGPETVRGDIRYKTLSDGTTVTLRGSLTGPPTVSIQHAGGTVTKIRY